MLYEIIPGRPRRIDFQIVQDRTRIPMLECLYWDAWELTEQSEKLRARLMAALSIMRVVLPHHMLAIGPRCWPDAPGLDLGLLVQLLAHAGLLVPPPGVQLIGWGQIDGAGLKPAAGAYALADVAAADGPVWLLAPAVDPRVATIPGVRVFDVRTLDDLLQPLESREVSELDPYTQGTIRAFEGDPPDPEIARTIEVAIAGRFQALLIGRSDVLGDWEGYAAAVLPPRTAVQARACAARSSCFADKMMPADLDSPVVKVDASMAVSRLRSRHEPGSSKHRLGDVAAAHEGLLLINRVDDLGERTASAIGDVILRCGEFFGGERLDTRTTMIAAMPPCACTLRRCWCQPVQLQTIRSRVRRGLPRLDLFGSTNWRARSIFMAPPTVRVRIERAWRRQDAELGEGARFGDLGSASINHVARVLELLDVELGPRTQYEAEARCLTNTPW